MAADQGQAGLAAANDDQDYFDDRFGLEAQATYTFTNGKVWAGVSSYEVAGVTDYDATAADVGAAFNIGNLGLVAYYYSGEGNGGGNSLNRLGTGTVPNLSAAGQEREQDGPTIAPNKPPVIAPRPSSSPLIFTGSAATNVPYLTVFILWVSD